MCTFLKQTQCVTKSTDTITNHNDNNTHANRTPNTNQYTHKTRIQSRESDREGDESRAKHQPSREKLTKNLPTPPMTGRLRTYRPRAHDLARISKTKRNLAVRDSEPRYTRLILELERAYKHERCFPVRDASAVIHSLNN
ncbi:unnamed protein product, partial [Ectocarpus sp. 8 AP-2014]